MLENKDEIELGKTSNVFAGPQDYYKVVIDDFDGKTIKAWHLEDKDGNTDCQPCRPQPGTAH